MTVNLVSRARVTHIALILNAICLLLQALAMERSQTRLVHILKGNHRCLVVVAWALLLLFEGTVRLAFHLLLMRLRGSRSVRRVGLGISVASLSLLHLLRYLSLELLQLIEVAFEVESVADDLGK